jgi:hypothetical protein
MVYVTWQVVECEMSSGRQSTILDDFLSSRDNVSRSRTFSLRLMILDPAEHDEKTVDGGFQALLI